MSHPEQSDSRNSPIPSSVPLEGYRLLFHTIPSAFALALDGILADCNEALAKLFRYKREEMIGRHITDFVSPNDRSIALERIRQRRAGENPEPKIIYTLIRSDGSEFKAEVAVVGIAPGLDAAFLQDVTRWMESTAQLAAVETFRSQLEPDSLEKLDQITSAAGKLMGACCAIYYRIEDNQISVAGSWQLPPDHPEVVNMNDCISHITVCSKSKECICQDNVQNTGFAITDPAVSATGCRFYIGQLVTKAGIPIGILSLFHTSERKVYTTEKHFMQDMADMLAMEEARLASEEALRQSEAKFRQRTNELQAIFTAIPDLYFRMKSDGTILEYFTGVPSLLYVSKEDFLGRRMQEVIPEPASRIIEAAICETVKTGRITFAEYSLPMPQGELQYEARIIKHSEDEVIAVVRNITEQKEAQETVMKSLAALERAYQLQSEFVRNMTHDVRTPLTAVIGYTQVLLDGMAGQLTNDQREVLKKIVGQANTLLGIVEEILESAKLAAGVQKLDIRTLRVDSIIRDAAALIEPSAKEKRITLEISVPDHLPMILSDSQKLTRILTNLLVNAVKFTFDGSVSIRAEQYSSGIELIIEDTGIGIPEDRLNLIFDAFVQLSYPKKHKPAGTGLGLSIVAELVDVLKCSLTVSSIPDLGTAFMLHVPLKIEHSRTRKQ